MSRPESDAMRRLSVIFNRAVSVLRWGRKLDWKSYFFIFLLFIFIYYVFPIKKNILGDNSELERCDVKASNSVSTGNSHTSLSSELSRFSLIQI